MNWNPPVDVSYVNNSFPYNSAGSFINFFEGLAYEHVNFIFSDALHVQWSMYPCMRTSTYKFGLSEPGSLSYYDYGDAHMLNAHMLNGYMSPEYVMHGQFFAKSDVFSFGVLVLEIISGKKNNNFYQSDGASDLVSHSWKLWKKGTPLDLMDPTLEGSQYFRNEVTRCIRIARMCLQNDPDARHSMAMVVQMLNNYSSTLSVPRRPGFLGWNKTGSNIFKELEADHRSTSKSIQYSINEASISELQPR